MKKVITEEQQKELDSLISKLDFKYYCSEHIDDTLGRLNMRNHKKLKDELFFLLSVFGCNVEGCSNEATQVHLTFKDENSKT